MRITFQGGNPKDAGLLAKTIRDAEKVRQDTEGASFLLVDDSGCHVLLVADCDGYSVEEIRAFAGKRSAIFRGPWDD